MTWQILAGDCRESMATLPEKSVQTCVTSPPYFGLRDYGHEGQIGLEPTPDEFVAALVAVFREMWRVLRDDGTVWLNLGDSYLRKSLVGIPWRVALALQADGWLLRCDVIWDKPNILPEGSAHDRPMRNHEYIFLLSKLPAYHCDMAAIAEAIDPAQAEHNQKYARVFDAPRIASRLVGACRGTRTTSAFTRDEVAIDVTSALYGRSRRCP